MYRIQYRQTVQANLDSIWAFFSSPSNLNELTPPSLQFEILSGASEEIHSGQIVSYRITLFPLVRCRWLTEIKHVVPLRSFVDEQRLGPYKFWYHVHTFVPRGSLVEVIDTVHYAIGYPPMGSLLNTLWVRHHLEAIFSYRRQRMTVLFPGP